MSRASFNKFNVSKSEYGSFLREYYSADAPVNTRFGRAMVERFKFPEGNPCTDAIWATNDREWVETNAIALR